MCSKRATDGAEGRAAKRHWPLSATLTLWYTLACFSIVCLAAALMYVGLVANLDEDHDQFLIGKADAMRQLIRERPGDLGVWQEEADEAWASSQYARVCARVLDADGHTLVESSRMGPDLSVRAFADVTPAGPTSPVGTTLYSPTGKPFRGLVVRCEDGSPGARPFTVQVALETYGPSHLLLAFRHRLYLLLGVLLAVSAVIGHLLARRGLRPIARMSDSASGIGSTTLDQRLDVSACPAEVATLAAAFNGALDRLEEAFDRLSRFSADIAHELRTPVNNLRVQVEVTLQRERSGEEYRHALASSLEEGVRLTRIIDSLLFLARAGDPATHVTCQTLDPAAEVGVLRDFYEAAATEAGVELAARCETSTPLYADRALFQRAVGNLIENALAHTEAGGGVTVVARDGANGEVVVEVSDTGCGIPFEHLSRIADRFYRVAPSRWSEGKRVGLGLSIVKSIATLHGGVLEIRSEVGRGTNASVSFPAREATGGVAPSSVRTSAAARSVAATRLPDAR